MKRFLLFALWVAAAVGICACGEDDEWSKLKSRCVDDYCAVVQSCSTNPADYDACISSCNAFNNAEDGAEYKDFFLCKMECVDDAASPTAECTCLLSFADGGPNC